MASESVANYLLSADGVDKIRDLLLEGIKASAKLERLRDNVESAAKLNWPASHIVNAGMLPIESDFDAAEAAEWVQCLGMLHAGREA